MSIALRIGGLAVGSSVSSLHSQYLFTETIDGVDFTLRKTVRMQGADEVYCVDMTLTDLGFVGTEDIDYEMIYGIEV